MHSHIRTIYVSVFQPSVKLSHVVGHRNMRVHREGPQKLSCGFVNVFSSRYMCIICANTDTNLLSRRPIAMVLIRLLQRIRDGLPISMKLRTSVENPHKSIRSTPNNKEVTGF